jgi:hypothetical protein
VIANISYPPLTNYGRRKARGLLIASRTWILSHKREAAPCDLCPPSRRLVTRTEIVCTFDPDREYRICYKCLGRLSLRRELHQNQYERRLYGLR